MKKLNNKGYMLVEIILAFAIAMGIAYFMFELIIKMKNKNDDLLVKTLVATDQAIIYNTIMSDIYTNGFNCNDITNYKEALINNNMFYYENGTTPKSKVSEYAIIESVNCTSTDLKIPIKVKQLNNEDFSINIKIYDVAGGIGGAPIPGGEPSVPSGASECPANYPNWSGTYCFKTENRPITGYKCKCTYYLFREETINTENQDEANQECKNYCSVGMLSYYTLTTNYSSCNFGGEITADNMCMYKLNE